MTEAPNSSTNENQNSSLINPSSTIPWPEGLPEQVAAVRKLLPTIGQEPESLSACFGRKAKKRTDQITGILATLKALGHIS